MLAAIAFQTGPHAQVDAPVVRTAGGAVKAQYTEFLGILYAAPPLVIGQTRDERTQSMFASRDHVARPVTAAQYPSATR